MAFFTFCVLVLVKFWLLVALLFGFWLLASVGSCFCFWPFSIKQHTSKVNECFFEFFLCSFYSLHFPTTPHMSYLSTCSRISRYVSAISLENFTNIVHLAPFPRFSFSISFLDMFMPTFAECSNMRASYIQLKGTAAQSTRARNILAKSKEHKCKSKKTWGLAQKTYKLNAAKSKEHTHIYIYIAT